MSTTQTKKLSEATVVQSIADADKIPIVNSSGQTVLVPLSGLLGAVKVGACNLMRASTTSTVAGARHTKAVYLNPSFGAGSNFVSRRGLTRVINEPGYYAISFWIKTTGEPITLRNIEINDHVVMSKVNVDSDWQYFEGSVMVTMNLALGFVDFEVPVGHENEVIVSDITVVKGNVPLQEWVPAPEDLNWGGVKLSLSAVCAFAAQLSAWKGGSQHEPNEGLDERGAKGYHDERDGVQRRRKGAGRLHSARVLLGRRQYNIPLSPKYSKLELWDSGSISKKYRIDNSSLSHRWHLRANPSISARHLEAVAPNCHDRDIATRKEVAV